MSSALSSLFPLGDPPSGGPRLVARLLEPLAVTGRGIRTAVRLTPSLRKAGLPGAEHLKMSPAALVATVLVNAFGLMLPLAVLEVYDTVIPNSAGETLLLLVLGFIGLTAIEVFLRIARAFVTGHGAAKFEAQLTTEAIGRMTGAERRELESEQDARQLARFASINRLADFYGGQMRWALLDIPFVVLYLGCMALIAGWLALVPLALLAVAVVISANITDPAIAVARQRDEEEARLYDFIGETLSGVTTVKGAAMEAFMARRFERLLGRSRELGQESILVSGQAENLSALLGNVTLISIGAVGGMMAIAGDLSVGTLAACTLLAGRVVQPVMRATSIVRTLNVLSLARDESNRLVTLPQQAASPRPPGRPEFRARGVRLPHGGEDAAPIDLTIPFGDTVCVTSADSAERSALMRVLAGDAAPLTGEVSLGGFSASGSGLSGRGGIAYVSPQTELFAGTILENLTAFDLGGALEDVIAVCELLGVREAIDRLPAGFETFVGDRASDTLQSGLAQRIAIARALALRPKVIILDEPQAQLDSHADRLLLEGLARVRGRITMIIGSQRPSYLALATRAYTLDNGRLTERAPIRAAASPSADSDGGRT